MRGILVDSNIILDVFLDDPNWAEWSESKLFQKNRRIGVSLDPIRFPDA